MCANDITLHARFVANAAIISAEYRPSLLHRLTPTHPSIHRLPLILIQILFSWASGRRMTKCKKLATTSAQTEATFRSSAPRPLSTVSWPTHTHTYTVTNILLYTYPYRCIFSGWHPKVEHKFSSTVSKKAHFWHSNCGLWANRQDERTTKKKHRTPLWKFSFTSRGDTN